MNWGETTKISSNQLIIQTHLCTYIDQQTLCKVTTSQQTCDMCIYSQHKNDDVDWKTCQPGESDGVHPSD